MTEEQGESPVVIGRPADLEPLLTIDDVAHLLRVPVLTVRWLRQEGRFAPAVKIGRRLAWTRSDIASWVAAQREAA